MRRVRVTMEKYKILGGNCFDLFLTRQEKVAAPCEEEFYRIKVSLVEIVLLLPVPAIGLKLRSVMEGTVLDTTYHRWKMVHF
jgi:hypothetical protein